MNRNRFVLASIASLAFGILGASPKTSLGCDYGNSWGAAYAPAYSQSAYYGGGCATTCCRPSCCPTNCCSSCCTTGCCSTGCGPAGCSTGGCSTEYDPTQSYQQTYYRQGGHATRPYTFSSRPASARENDRRAAAAPPRGAATQIVKIPPSPTAARVVERRAAKTQPVLAAPQPIPARVAQKAPVRMTVPTVRAAKVTQPKKLNSDWTPVSDPQIATNR